MFRLRWLHISDLHFYDQKKPSGLRFDQKIVTRQLLRDVATMGSKLGAPDVVLLTGDLAFQAADEEYDAASKWLTDLRQELNAPNVPTLMVPGNHDVDRSAIKKTLTRQLVHEKLREQPDRLDDFLHDEADRRALLDKQLPFFNKMLNLALSDAASIRIPMGPRDLPQVTMPSGVIPLLLNSALLAGDEKDSSQNLMLGNQQLNVLDEQSPQELLLVLSHHPPSWLRDGKKLLKLLEKRPHLLFTGHEHEQGGTVSNRLNGGSVMHFTAGAGFGDQQGEHAYSWGELSARGLVYYSRIWHRGTFSFVSDPIIPEFGERTPDGSGYKIASSLLPKPLREWLARAATAPTPPPVAVAAAALPVTVAAAPSPTPAPVSATASATKPGSGSVSPQSSPFRGLQSLAWQPQPVWRLSRWLAWAVHPQTGFGGFRTITSCVPRLAASDISALWKLSAAKPTKV